MKGLVYGGGLLLTFASLAMAIPLGAQGPETATADASSPSADRSTLPAPPTAEAAPQPFLDRSQNGAKEICVAILSGIYLPRLPFPSKLDFRVETVYPDPSVRPQPLRAVEVQFTPRKWGL